MSYLDEENCTVAIIGASYAGLSLGNTLQKHSISFIIFESSQNYYDDENKIVGQNTQNNERRNKNEMRLKPHLFVIGPFILPSFANLLENLGLHMSCETRQSQLGKNCDVECCYERSNVISTLIHKIQHRIKYDTTITKIIKSQGGEGDQSFYCCCNRDDEKKYGPFEYVIGADGVHSMIGSNHKMKDDNRILLIGDARWVNDSWYDFGFNRVREGGNVAIQDGFELGSCLAKLIQHDSYSNCTIQSMVKQKYSANQRFLIRRKKQLIRRMVVMFFAAFIVEQFRRGRK